CRVMSGSLLVWAADGCLLTWCSSQCRCRRRRATDRSVPSRSPAARHPRGCGESAWPALRFLDLDGISWLRSGPGLAAARPAYRDQAQPEAADLRQDSVQRRLIGEHPRDDCLGALAADLEAAEPVRPPVIEDAVDTDLVAGRPPRAIHARPPVHRTRRRGS